VVEGWLDLAHLVASEGGKSKSPYEDLAYKIGGSLSCSIASRHYRHNTSMQAALQ